MSNSIRKGRLHTNFFHPHHPSAWKHTFHDHQMATNVSEDD